MAGHGSDDGAGAGHADPYESMPRRELQAVAKAAGIKANGKSADLIASLRALRSQCPAAKPPPPTPVGAPPLRTDGDPENFFRGLHARVAGLVAASPTMRDPVLRKSFASLTSTLLDAVISSRDGTPMVPPRSEGRWPSQSAGDTMAGARASLALPGGGPPFSLPAPSPLAGSTPLSRPDVDMVGRSPPAGSPAAGTHPPTRLPQPSPRPLATQQPTAQNNAHGAAGVPKRAPPLGVKAASRKPAADERRRQVAAQQKALRGQAQHAARWR